MSYSMLNSSSHLLNGRKSHAVRAHVVPNVLSRRRRFRRAPCGPSLMELSPLDAFFDMSPANLLETEDFLGLERVRPMAVDFVEDRKGFQIKADIPGVTKQDIKVDVDHNVITISAKHSSQTSANCAQDQTAEDDQTTEVVAGDNNPEVVETEASKLHQNDANVLRYERYESFQARSFRVPKSANLSTISAKYQDGVLTVDIQKKEDQMMEEKRTVDIA